MTKPLKRHEALKPLSRDHHQGLLLCWKIREGLKKGISEERIKAYTDFFFSTQLQPHFRFEEEQVFPMLGKDHPMRTRAIKEHSRLRSLFEDDANKDAFDSIVNELNRHIRFEERELFMELQDTVAEEKLQQLDQIEEEITTPDPDEWEDKFWLKNN